MNFLEICQTVDTLSGIQGSIADTASTLGIQSVIVESVKEAWLLIQNYRKDWTFMIDTTHFSTVPNQSEYTVAEVFTNDPTKELGMYLKDKMFYENRPVPFAEYSEFPYIPNTQSGALRWWTYEPSNNIIHLSLPNDIYRLDFYFIKNSQVLVNSVDIPELPERFHQLIVYKALELLNTYLGNAEMTAKASQQYTRLLGSLLRVYIEQRSVHLRGGIA